MSRGGRITAVVTAVVVVVLAAAVVGWAQGVIRERAEWLKSRHANRPKARAEATVEGRGLAAAHCARCHSEQGFLAWLPQLARGDPGWLKQPDGSPADLVYMASLGLTKFSVRSQTCATCHNPDGITLRMSGDTPMLPSGFRARGVGDGATCMACHNTRNGAIVWNSPDPRTDLAPHTSSQADVVMAQNAYFVPFGDALVSPHGAFTGGACATCHVRLGPGQGHTFKASRVGCAACHEKGVQIENVQAPAKAMIKELKGIIEGRIMAAKDRIRTIRAYDPKTGAFTDNVAVDPATIRSATLYTVGGRQGVKLILTTGQELYSQLGGMRDAAGRPSFSTADPIIRAGWNYWLIEGDGSFGVHNPRFVRLVLTTTLDELGRR